MLTTSPGTNLDNKFNNLYKVENLPELPMTKKKTQEETENLNILSNWKLTLQLKTFPRRKALAPTAFPAKSVKYLRKKRQP